MAFMSWHSSMAVHAPYTNNTPTKKQMVNIYKPYKPYTPAIGDHWPIGTDIFENTRHE
jgi:hypothetical protein